MQNLFADSSEVFYVKTRLIYVNTALFTHVFAFQEISLGSTDTFCEQGQ